MAKLNFNVLEDPTLTAMDKAMELQQSLEKPRHYLGASEIGKECERYLFYSFRNACKRNIPAKGLKAIQDGYDQEDKTIERLRAVTGIELYNNDGTVNDKGEKNQIGFDDMLLGHFRGHIDGMILGLLQAPQTWHVFEHKAVNETKFNKLKKLIAEKGEKEALKLWDEVYYGQAQVYMHKFQKERHYTVVCTPGGRDHVSVRTDYNRKYAEILIEKARRIIFDNWSIPYRISEKREFFQCNWCQFKGICHDGDIPDIHCKTCRYREPVENGQNKCLIKECLIEENMLNVGCPQHIYNPALIPGVKFIEHQIDGCLYSIPEKNFFFANTNLAGFPDVKGQLNAIYTSIDLKDKIKNINNITKEVSKVQQTFKGELISDKAKAWDSLSPDISGLVDL